MNDRKRCRGKEDCFGSDAFEMTQTCNEDRGGDVFLRKAKSDGAGESASVRAAARGLPCLRSGALKRVRSDQLGANAMRKQRMKNLFLLITILAGMALAGCHHQPPPFMGMGPGHHGECRERFGAGWSNWMGAARCAGRVALQNGAATVRDSCFTGDTNVVLCTDATAANPIRCTPEAGSLSISGSGSDLISYARVE